MTFKTEQEAFWHGEFGSAYIDRNKNVQNIASNIHLFSRILTATSDINSIIEFGSNVGLNLIALQQLKPSADLCGIEINPQAVRELQQLRGINVIEGSMLEIEINDTWDLSFTKGVLIHLNPDYLSIAYQQLYAASRKYILIAEYYNPTPLSLNYRGHSDRLFKRDFAGELMDRYTDLELVDYGFVYHRDPNFKQDDVTWFLLEKIKVDK